MHYEGTLGAKEAKKVKGDRERERERGSRYKGGDGRQQENEQKEKRESQRNNEAMGRKKVERKRQRWRQKSVRWGKYWMTNCGWSSKERKIIWNLNRKFCRGRERREKKGKPRKRDDRGVIREGDSKWLRQ